MDNTARTVLVIGAAMTAGCVSQEAAFGQAAAKALYPTPEFPTCIAKAPTDCRLADGHPDLSGLWAAGGPSVGGGGGVLASGSDGIDFPGRGGSFVGHEADAGLYRLTTIDTRVQPALVKQGADNSKVRNLPEYKAQWWDVIVDRDYNGNFEDPQQQCLPNGVPRNGAPAAIIALQGQPWVELIYSLREIRMVPTDGRSHNLINIAAETWNGDSVGHWEGDTLVIETTGFTDASWLHKNGYIHGFEMKVTERLTRTNNQLRWEATVEDPEYLAKPWVLTPISRNLSMDPNDALYEPLPCLERDAEHTTSHVRSG